MFVRSQSIHDSILWHHRTAEILSREIGAFVVSIILWKRAVSSGNMSVDTGIRVSAGVRASEVDWTRDIRR